MVILVSGNSGLLYCICVSTYLYMCILECAVILRILKIENVIGGAYWDYRRRIQGYIGGAFICICEAHYICASHNQIREAWRWRRILYAPRMQKKCASYNLFCSSVYSL